MARTPVSEWGRLFNFAGGGLIHLELFPVFAMSANNPTLFESIAAYLTLSGTIAARPSAANVPLNALYFATDTGNAYLNIAGTWTLVAIAAAPSTSNMPYASVTLTNAQIQALPTTPITLVAAPGANKIIKLIGADARSDFTAGAYSNVSSNASMYLALDATNLHQVSTQTAAADRTTLFSTNARNWSFDPDQAQTSGTAGQSKFATLNQNFTTQYVNQPLVLTMTNTAGNLTAGNAANSLVVTVTYSITTV